MREERDGNVEKSTLVPTFCGTSGWIIPVESILVSLVIRGENIQVLPCIVKKFCRISFSILDELFWHRQISEKKNSSLSNLDEYRLTIKSHRIKAVMGLGVWV